jgi:hypothetical protein
MNRQKRGTDGASLGGQVQSKPVSYCAGRQVVVYPGTGRQARGSIVEDFGEFSAEAVEVNNIRIAEPARRWAVCLDDGGLVFVDSEDLSLE